MTAALITFTKKSVAHLWSTSREIRLDNSLTYVSSLVSPVCYTADANCFDYGKMACTIHLPDTVYESGVTHSTKPNKYSTQDAFSVKVGANTSTDLGRKPTWVWPINFSDWSHKHNPDAAQHNMEKWLEQDEYTLSRRNTLSDGGLGASFNMANHISSSHSL